MRQPTKKTVSKVLQASLFLLSLKLAFPTLPAYAFLTSVDKCAASPPCQKAVLPELTKAVIKTGAATTVLTPIVINGTAQPVSDAAAPVVIVGGQGQANTPVYYWNISLNEQAKALARSKFCGFYPQDSLCQVPLAGGQIPGIPYSVTVLETTSHPGSSIYPGRIATHTHGFHRQLGDTNKPFIGPITGTYQEINPPPQYSSHGVISSEGPVAFILWGEYYFYGTATYTGQVLSIQPLYGQPDVSNPKFIKWQNWPKAKREAAVNLISPAEWRVLIRSMPVAGKLNPGQTVRSPFIVIPGEETDDPNTPLIDERLPRVVSPSFTLPGGSAYEVPDEIAPGLTKVQKWRVEKRVKDGLLNPEDVDKGELRPITDDEEKRNCLYIPIRRLGDNEKHNEYAEEVLGSTTDLFVVSPWGHYAHYDGELTAIGEATLPIYGGEKPGAVAEVKTEHLWLLKLVYNQTLTPREKRDYDRIRNDQLPYQAEVARECKLNYFIAFDQKVVADIAGPMIVQWIVEEYPAARVRHIPHVPF